MGRAGLFGARVLIRLDCLSVGLGRPEGRAHGSQGCQLMRSADNPNEVVIVFKWDSVENARQFTQMPALREIMQQAGVVTMPDFYFLEEVDQGAA